MLSAAANATDLLEPGAWQLSQELLFSAVQGRVPSNWSRPRQIVSDFGWLEGNAVQPVDGRGSGVNILLRVNSLPSANKAALVRLASPDAAPVFERFIEYFPGGMSKFTVRRDLSTQWSPHK